ncbi:TonB-dependent siderophore receptor [Roseomonas sp. KE2513]|uniref:TonB-dependent receptor n=1 Tax=Roseomonas sp. KE2513 TaxID=2479202 RepID=UPI0018DFBD13|nr:TonB-dependent siderophore receptor [Roseomonas sp. KE2513]MBI0536777.1 TonB-dependent siderophore receptor [Roseomonas sp. KE2513]
MPRRPRPAPTRQPSSTWAGRAALLLAATALGSGAVPFALAQTAAPEPSSDGVVAVPTVDVRAAPASTNGYQATRSRTATRTDTPLRDVPQSVGVITQEAIRDLSVQNLQDALRFVPGAGFAQGEGNRDTPVLRGYSSTANLFVDGLRDDVEYYRDLYNIDRVEVLLGPSAMIFGRGGGGGVVNRVTKQPDWETIREVRLQTGSYNNYRGTIDLGQAINESVAFRILGMYEDTDTYRDGVSIRRYGINPNVAFRIGDSTTLRISYENFRDERNTDRGIPSFNGKPVRLGVSTFVGDPNLSVNHVNLNAVNVTGEHRFDNGVVVRNLFRYATYDKFYQNVFSGAVNASGTAVQLAAYNNATQRDNIINQTDVQFALDTGPIRHTFLAGFEYQRQVSDNFRNTGYFTAVGPNATSFTTPLSATRVSTPVLFRQSATDANNHGVATSAAVYVQDQIQLLPQVQLIAGLRYENFDVDFTNNRNGAQFNATDNKVSPRIGLVYKPIEPVSLYASYSTSYLPRAGEQLASLSLTNANLRPESFTNYEIGAKWDLAQSVSLNAALFRLERNNVAVTDPNDISRLILVDGTRAQGLEIGARGRVTNAWSVIGGYAYTEGEISSDQSTTIRKGNSVPYLARHTASLWNRYDFTENWGAGLGVIAQSAYFAATDNAVRIPGFARVDAAVFWKINERWGAQVNAENLLGTRYYPVAHSNNNITPGAPFSVRAALTARF